MAKIIDGKAVSAAVRAGAKQEVEALKAQGIQPGLAVVIVGDDPASRVYVNNKKKACAEIGIHSEEYALPKETTQEELLDLVRRLNDKKDINGFSSASPAQGPGRKGSNRDHFPSQGRRCVPSPERGADHDRRLSFSALYSRWSDGTAEIR